jgi:hypothetical protein
MPGRTWIGRLEVGQETDPGVALGDPAEGVGEGGDAGVELAQRGGQLLVFTLEAGGARQVHAAAHGGVAQDEREQDEQAQPKGPDLQDRLGNLDGPGRARAFGYHHERPAAICHSPALSRGVGAEDTQSTAHPPRRPRLRPAAGPVFLQHEK